MEQPSKGTDGALFKEQPAKEWAGQGRRAGSGRQRHWLVSRTPPVAAASGRGVFASSNRHPASSRGRGEI